MNYTLWKRKSEQFLSKNDNMYQVSNEDIIGTSDPEFGVEFYKKVGKPDTIHFKEIYYRRIAKILNKRFQI